MKLVFLLNLSAFLLCVVFSNHFCAAKCGKKYIHICTTVPSSRVDLLYGISTLNENVTHSLPASLTISRSLTSKAQPLWRNSPVIFLAEPLHHCSWVEHTFDFCILSLSTVSIVSAIPYTSKFYFQKNRKQSLSRMNLAETLSSQAFSTCLRNFELTTKALHPNLNQN